MVGQNINRETIAIAYRVVLIGGAMLLIVLDFFHLPLSTFFAIPVMFATLVVTLFALFVTNLKTVLTGITALCIGMSIFINHWPFQLRFRVSRPALTELVEQKSSGEEVEVPVRAGLFRIVRISRRSPASTCFWTVGRGDFVGLAYCDTNEPRFNIWTQLDLGDGWYYVVED